MLDQAEPVLDCNFKEETSIFTAVWSASLQTWLHAVLGIHRMLILVLHVSYMNRAAQDGEDEGDGIA